ncbi:AAEL009155-PA [Aedes aegypti]|uniref:AAEL009155-PA n=1 Tax=Aedes aegypti TaxID=7159 RepID=Q0IEP1_AEDAE|nr:AAEL009155-PA [Aedes aegypti]
MIRLIFGCLGRILQLLRNNIKPLILLTSFGTFIWLIVSTTNRPEFTRHSQRTDDSGLNDLADINPDQRWDQNSVDIFLRLLDIEGNLTSLVVQSQDESCPLKDEIIFSAFSGDSLEENLWQYYTLIAVRQKLAFSSDGFVIVPFLPLSTKQRLESIFEE